MRLHRLGCGARNRATMLAKVAQPPVAHPIAISCTPTALYTPVPGELTRGSIVIALLE
jgi:hypothetical protein